jgi:hypothetical protein
MLRPALALAVAGATAVGATDAAAAGPLPGDRAWPPLDAAGVTRHAAPGLLSGAPPAGVALASGAVTKAAANPLFGQDKPWEPRLDNGYPNVVYDPASKGDGPWRLFYGGIAPGGQYMYYANSTDGLAWHKPALGRYDIGEKMPHLKRYGKATNIFMFGGGLGVFHDAHEPDPALRYKIAGGSPAGCYGDDGASDCAVATAGSPDGIGRWSDVDPLRFAKPWRPDCHTNLFYDARRGGYLMTTRDFTEPSGRDISIAASGQGSAGGGPTHFGGNWSLVMAGKYPPTEAAAPCERVEGKPAGAAAAAACGRVCRATDGCAFFWVYTEGSHAGGCCPKRAVEPGPPRPPSCASCGGQFYRMDGAPTKPPPPPPGKPGSFGDWGEPVIVAKGSADHQLYSQITWPFYDIYLGIVMIFDATDGTKGAHAGHVHCRLAWSADPLANWSWVDPGGLGPKGAVPGREFIPAGPLGSFDSHVCFAAHMPLKMPDGSARVYYMGGDGPHSGARNSSFALATLPPDRFAGLQGTGEIAATKVVRVAGPRLLITADVRPGGAVTVGVVGHVGTSAVVTGSVTDHAVAGLDLSAMVGRPAPPPRLSRPLVQGALAKSSIRQLGIDLPRNSPGAKHAAPRALKHGPGGAGRQGGPAGALPEGRDCLHRRLLEVSGPFWYC